MGGQRSSRVMLGAGLSGVLIFAGTTGFGRTVRMVEPLPQQIDQALVAAGLGVNEVMLSGHRYTTDADIYAALAYYYDNREEIDTDMEADWKAYEHGKSLPSKLKEKLAANPELREKFGG